VTYENEQAERLVTLGGTDAADLMNMEQYGRGCRTQLAYRKLNVEPDFPVEQDDALLARGNILEPIVAQMYEEATGRKLRSVPRMKRHPLYSWASVSTDRLILTGHGGVEAPGDLEIKTRGEGPWYRIQRSGPFPSDLLQPQWSMFVTGHTWGALAVLGVFGGLPLLHYDVERDNELIDIFRVEGEEFAERVWGKGLIPTPTIPATDRRCKVCPWRQTCRGEQIDEQEVADLKAMRKSGKPLFQVNNPELSTTLSDLQLMKSERKALDDAIELAQHKAVDLIGEGVEGALVRGFGKVYVMPSKFNGIDQHRLKTEQPDIYQAYYVSRLTGGYYLRLYPSDGK
jgi:predicted phage-related endonuclease